MMRNAAMDRPDAATNLDLPGPELYRALWAYASDLVTIVDVDGTIRYASPSYQRVLGHDPARFLGTSAFDLIHPDDRAAAAAAFVTALHRKGAPTTATLRCRHGDGSWRDIEVTGSAHLEDPVVRGLVLNGRDVTERQRAKEELLRLQDEFLALASHELRTPLTPLQGYLELLRSLSRPEAAGARYAEAALEQVERLKVLVGDFLDAGRLQTGKLRLDMRPVDVGAVVTRAVEVTRMEAPVPRIILDAAPSVVVNGDAIRLEQVVLNLLGNAVKHAPASPCVKVWLRAVDGMAELRVRDYGPGIAAADLPHLFRRFYQVARQEGPSRQGLGLGLFIAREVVLAHGGAIDVASTEGAGATFTVRLPLL